MHGREDLWLLPPIISIFFLIWGQSLSIEKALSCLTPNEDMWFLFYFLISDPNHVERIARGWIWPEDQYQRILFPWQSINAQTGNQLGPPNGIIDIKFHCQPCHNNCCSCQKKKSQVKDSWLDVQLCQVGSKDCQLSNSTNSKGVLRLPKHSNEETVSGLVIYLF